MNVNNINMSDFLKDFNEAYQIVYDYGDQLIDNYQDLVCEFDEFIYYEKNSNFVNRFNKFRGDVILSDNEAAAFMIAYHRLENKEKANKIARVLYYTTLQPDYPDKETAIEEIDTIVKEIVKLIQEKKIIVNYLDLLEMSNERIEELEKTLWEEE